MSIIINATDIMLNNNEETDVSYVSIAVSNAMDLKQLHNFSINPIIKIDTQLNATFSYHSHSVDLTNISAHIIVVDKCGQESLSEVINCGSKGIVNNFYILYSIGHIAQCHNIIIFTQGRAVVIVVLSSAYVFLCQLLYFWQYYVSS